jgi:hypothetical protein
LHDTEVTDGVVVIAAGSVTIAVVVAEQLLVSVTVRWYVPAARLLIVALVCPLLHTYVKPGVPPDGLATAEPLVKPLQLILVTVGAASVMAGFTVATAGVLSDTQSGALITQL